MGWSEVIYGGLVNPPKQPKERDADVPAEVRERRDRLMELYGKIIALLERHGSHSE